MYISHKQSVIYHTGIHCIIYIYQVSIQSCISYNQSYIHTYIHTHTHTHTYTYTHLYIHTPIHTHTYTYTIVVFVDIVNLILLIVLAVVVESKIYTHTTSACSVMYVFHISVQLFCYNI